MQTGTVAKIAASDFWHRSTSRVDTTNKHSVFLLLCGLTENDGYENDGSSKLQDAKIAGREFARYKNARHEIAEHENVGHEIAG